MTRRWALIGLGAACALGGALWLGLQPGERRLHVERSAFQTLVVVEQGGRRCLRFGEGSGALNQSCRSLSHPEHVELDYARAVVVAARAMVPAPRRVLIIGLGGGSISSSLIDADPTIAIDAVELDPAVIAIATRYFGFQPSERVRGIAGDGREFVASAVDGGAASYDLVILDAFDDRGVVPELFSETVLAQVKMLLRPEGVFIANTFASAPGAAEELSWARAVFGAVQTVDVRRNRLLVSGPLSFPRESTPALERLGADGAWLGEIRVSSTP